MFGSQERKMNFGLLIMRLGLAVALLFHALPIIIGGGHAWQGAATMLGFINVSIPPTILGVIILLLETLGAVGLLLGYYFRITCLALFIIFSLYFLNYFSIGYKILMLWSLGIAAVLLGLIFLGPGRYALTVRFGKK